MIRRVPAWAWLTISALVGIAIGAAWPPPPIPKSMQQEASWSIPTEASLVRFSAESFKSASQGLRWDSAGSKTEDERKTWRLAGFLNAPPTIALIQVEGIERKAEQVKPGDTLPDGNRVVAIAGDTITIEYEDCRQVFQLYHSLPISRSSGCEASTDDAEARKTP